MFCPGVGWLRHDGRRWTGIGAAVAISGTVGFPRIAFAGVFVPALPMPADGDNDRGWDGAA